MYIEGEYHQSKYANAPVVLVLHHHPQYGGNMSSKIVHNIYTSFIDNNFAALKINFRGVGKSTGTFDKGIGEITDAAVTIDWLQEHNPSNVPIWIDGFPFGAWVAMQLTMRRLEKWDTNTPKGKTFCLVFFLPFILVAHNLTRLSRPYTLC
ncbi:uncharacterized protein RP471-like [Calliopsis andreniformis]|uniref:uncharacterized protein RP471-like n=1 Tax=Calliopsis andreniformis TaxID=337506 RepID=UPI003FCEAC73